MAKKRTLIPFATKQRVIREVVAPKMKNEKMHFDDFDRKDVEDIISPSSNASISDQVRNCYSAVIKEFRDEESDWYNLTNALALEKIRSTIRKQPGASKNVSSDEAKKIASEFLDGLLSEEELKEIEEERKKLQEENRIQEVELELQEDQEEEAPSEPQMSIR